MRSSFRLAISHHAPGPSTCALRTTSQSLLTSSWPTSNPVRPEMGRGLVVLHVDGLGADSLENALRDGDMPFTQHLITSEGYTIHRYRCGVPSTTPFAQA